MFELVHEGIITVEQLVRKMCHNPADLYQLKGRGYLRPGYQADLVLVDPTAAWTLTPDRIVSKCGWSPLEGHRFTAQVDKTFVNGQLVYAHGKVDPDCHGQALVFER